MLLLLVVGLEGPKAVAPIWVAVAVVENILNKHHFFFSLVPILL
jgi:hypothetical protein